MKVLQETTKWKSDSQPNHVYLVDGDKMVAYQPWGTGTVQHFKKPMRFDTARRQFTELVVDSTLWGAVPLEPTHIVKVEGSRGATYEVNLERGSCTCSGYRFRGKCKHLALAQEETV